MVGWMEVAVVADLESCADEWGKESEGRERPADRTGLLLNEKQA